MTAWITRNLGWKLLALLLSAGLWLVTHSNPGEVVGAPGTEFHEPILSRNVPVEVRLTGVPPKGYSLSAVESYPSSTRVRGPQPVITPLESIRTEPINVGDLTGEQTITVPLRLPAAHTLFEGPSEVSVHLVVQQKK